MRKSIKRRGHRKKTYRKKTYRKKTRRKKTRRKKTRRKKTRRKRSRKMSGGGARWDAPTNRWVAGNPDPGAVSNQYGTLEADALNLLGIRPALLGPPHFGGPQGTLRYWMENHDSRGIVQNTGRQFMNMSLNDALFQFIDRIERQKDNNAKAEMINIANKFMQAMKIRKNDQKNNFGGPGQPAQCLRHWKFALAVGLAGLKLKRLQKHVKSLNKVLDQWKMTGPFKKGLAIKYIKKFKKKYKEEVEEYDDEYDSDDHNNNYNKGEVTSSDDDDDSDYHNNNYNNDETESEEEGDGKQYARTSSDESDEEEVIDLGRWHDDNYKSACDDDNNEYGTSSSDNYETESDEEQVEGRVCVECDEWEPRSNYSNNQWKKGQGVGRCKDCV